SFTGQLGHTYAFYSIARDLVGNVEGSKSTAEATTTVNSTTTPTVTWNNPASIVYGTPLGTNQLNASASVSGTFAYNPPLGTVFNGGNGQTLSVVFTPTDTSLAPVKASASINVTTAPLTVTANSASRFYASPNPPLTGSIVGLVNNDNITATYTTT